MNSNSYQIMNSNSFQLLNELKFYVKCIFALILVLIIFKHTKYTIRKHCVDMCARHGRGAIEICLSEKGALAKKRLGNTGIHCFKSNVMFVPANVAMI